MRHFKEILTPPWAIRMGFWLCLGLYILGFLLPVDLARPDQKGYSLFLGGLWGLMMAVWAPVYLIVGGPLQAWTLVLQIWLAVLPWLANPIMWFALAHFAMGNGRQAAGRALLAILFAAAVFLPGVWYLPPMTVSLSPAFLTWVASMLCLAIFGLLLARHNERSRVPADFEQSLTHWEDEASRALRAPLARWPRDERVRERVRRSPEAISAGRGEELGVRTL